MGLERSERRKIISDLLSKSGGFAVVDGGLATELERFGADLNDPLWSAKCLLTSPHLITRVHLDYIEAGANIIISASYQATLQGFEAKGIAKEEGEALLKRSVEIAREAHDTYLCNGTSDIWDHSVDAGSVKHPVLVAASIGSYGAYLADGSEYTGTYGEEVTLETLKEFHRRRVQVLDDSGADILAFETIPNKLEAKAFAEILEEENIQTPAWFSFSSKDGINVVSGDSISDCVEIVDSCDHVICVGINCTPPRFIDGLIRSIHKLTSKSIVVYPNSGETYDPHRKEWVASNGVSDGDFVSYVSKWFDSGASLIGGCCRTTPNTIKRISKALSHK